MVTTALSNRLRELSLLLEAGKAMNSLLELPQVLKSILDSALELLGGRSGSIMLVEDGSYLRTVCAAGNERADGAAVKLGEGISGKAVATLEPILLNGRADSESFPGLVAREKAVDSAMCVPLVHGDEAVGVINVNASGERSFSEYDLRALNLFAEQAASTITKARLFESQREQSEQLAHLALHDPLTGLANRVLFVDRTRQALARTKRHGGAVGVLFVDLDHFKAVNDNFGHAAGDELLAELARRLKAVVRPTDTVARFGGDEFAVLCDDLSGEADAVAVATRVQSALSAPIELKAGDGQVSASIGIAMAYDASCQAESLLRDADEAMYRAKHRGKACWQVHRPALAADLAAGAGGRLIP